MDLFRIIQNLLEELFMLIQIYKFLAFLNIYILSITCWPGTQNILIFKLKLL